MLIAAEAERRYIRDIFTALGAAEPERDALAEVLTEADLRGHGSHGLVRVPLNVNLIRENAVRTASPPVVTRETGPTAVIDGNHANGPYAAIFATQEAIGRARRYGIGTVSLSNCGHIGLAGYYPELAAREGCVGILAAKSESSVHPYGGLEPLVGTNPLAIAIPYGDDPFLLDMSTSAVAAGKVRQAARTGAALPIGSAVDVEGNPTIDAKAALAGALSAMGGAKGYGLSLAVEILGGLLVGGISGPMKASGGHRQLWSACIVVLDPGAFGDPARFQPAVSDFLATIKGSRKAPGFEEILIPGERSFRTRRERLASGVPIEDSVWQQVAVIARELGLDPDGYRDQ